MGIATSAQYVLRNRYKRINLKMWKWRLERQHMRYTASVPVACASEKNLRFLLQHRTLVHGASASWPVPVCLLWTAHVTESGCWLLAMVRALAYRAQPSYICHTSRFRGEADLDMLHAPSIQHFPGIGVPQGVH